MNNATENAVKEVRTWAYGNQDVTRFGRPQAMALSVRMVTKGFDRAGLKLMNRVEEEILGFVKESNPLVVDLADAEVAGFLVQRVIENVPELATA